MSYRVEVGPAPGAVDPRGSHLARELRDVGLRGVDRVEVLDLYFLDGPALGPETVAEIAERLLVDPVVERARWTPIGTPSVRAEGVEVEVAALPGVTDSVAESLGHLLRRLGFSAVTGVATGRRYTLMGAPDPAEVERAVKAVLCNPVIHGWSIGRPIDPPFVQGRSVEPYAAEVVLLHLDDDGLLRLSRDRRLSLDLAEMRAIQAYFQRQTREPTDLELEMLAQTWSEHCVHKTFRASIRYVEDTGTGPAPAVVVDGVLDTYIREATRRAGKPWIRSAFVDNAGIIALDETWDLAFKVETHNHPSALEPFGGANTGVGGVIRDVLGVSARPIACTDVLCFAPPEMASEHVPTGTLHPRRVADGVIAGIGDYGNKMGIPTVNGAIVYDPDYVANPLVYCGCLGILPHGSHPRSPRVGDYIVSIGGRTGRDGLRGATFSSMEMTVETSSVASASVQIGHAIHEKQVMEVVLRARDEGLYTAITDCGAGGLSSAVGEMSEELGARVQLERVPLKYAGLQPWEIWLSEAQERMVLAVPTQAWPRLLEICAEHDVEATDLGVFTGTGSLEVRYGDVVVGALDNHFLHKGIPRRSLNAVWTAPPVVPLTLGPCTGDLSPDLLAVLSLPDVRSKEDVVRTYDHEVQGGTVVRPFVGVGERGPSDGAVLLPLETTGLSLVEATGKPGVALAVGINPHYGRLDPYRMAWAAIDEAVRNVLCIGGNPDHLALLDNFCWGNPLLPDRLGSLVRCAKGCLDGAVAYGAPYVSGKDSLNNELTDATGARRAIPGTLLISAVAVVEDVAFTPTMDLKRAGNALYLVGICGDELGGSAWLRARGGSGGEAPRPREQAPAAYRALHGAIREGWVVSAHDCSEGGLGVALAEMVFAGDLGLRVDLRSVSREEGLDRPDVLLFAESLGRVLVEVSQDHCRAFEARMAGHPVARIGEVVEGPVLRILGLDGDEVVKLSARQIGAAWRGHLA